MIEPEDILEFVKFNAKVEKQTYTPGKKPKDMFDLQAEGAAGIINRLEKYNIALLSDEVGMGKTFQALATIARQFKENLDSKVLVITPRREVLRQWKNEEYEEFYKNHLLPIGKDNQKYLPLPVVEEKNKAQAKKAEIVDLYNFSEGLFLHANNKIIFAKATSFMTEKNFSVERHDKLVNDIKNFDLIIVDEAQKFRNYNDLSEEGDYQSYITKTAKLLFSNLKPDCKVLLMTATPLHSRKGDLKRVVDLFYTGLGDTDQEIMKKIMIRRLRIMTGGQNKYNYRQEIDKPISLSEGQDDYKNELFFAMLQKEYAQVNNSKNLSKSKHLLDYLEGTRFDDPGDKEVNNDDDIKKVISTFEEVYGQLPTNRKYEELIKLLPVGDKSLVFVRRTASAYEITRQYMEKFDKKAWKMIDDAWDKEKTLPMPAGRDNYEAMVNDYFTEEVEEVEDENYLPGDEKIKVPKSIILDLFKKKKEVKSTHASRFLQKFSSPKSPYSNFFKNDFPLIVKYNEEKTELIQSAVLHASIGLVELYCCDIKAKGSYDQFVEEVKNSSDNLECAKETKEFLDHFEQFKKYLVFNQNLQENDEKNDDGKSYIATDYYSPEIFHNSQPAYPYVSGTKNDNVISRFNSPFFPKLLCGTSTLQEGVNLHLFCNKVYHFGAAHTMGDDEQRIGRVDRVMGKMDRELSANKQATLDIYYPYLKATFDEDNLRKMLCNKRLTEKLIDNGDQIVKEAEDISCDKNINQLLEKPVKSGTSFTLEPYPFFMNKDIDIKPN